MTLTAEQVRAASAAWIWYPDNAETVETDEYLLVRFPEWADAELVALRFDPVRELSVVLPELLATASTSGLSELAFWVKLGAPDRLAPMLAHLGGTVTETVDVLALDLAVGAPDVGPHEVEVRWVDDVDSIRASHAVLVDVFGGQMPPEDRLRLEAWQTAADHEQGLGGAVVASVDGEPVGTAGITIADGVARLWSGSVREQHRGRGAYRAMLAARLAYGVEQGCTLGLVKGRVETSGPILQRLGFEAFGTERCYTMPL